MEEKLEKEKEKSETEFLKAKLEQEEKKRLLPWFLRGIRGGIFLTVASFFISYLDYRIGFFTMKDVWMFTIISALIVIPITWLANEKYK